jgi:Acyl-coenzyme A synthetases/AMP-(fatty) acid ligases
MKEHRTLPDRIFRVSEDRSCGPKDRLWDIIERYGVTQLYTAPTAIRTFMKWGSEEVSKHDLTSLRVLGTVGEPINPEAWMWSHENIGGSQTPIVDTWWQTETGGNMITPLPGVTTTKPGSACFAFPGVSSVVVVVGGVLVARGGGCLSIPPPWPSMFRGLWGGPLRFLASFWSSYVVSYFAGAGASSDVDGSLWLLGCVDVVVSVSGPGLSAAGVVSSFVALPGVADAAVVGAPVEPSGPAVIGSVLLRGGFVSSRCPSCRDSRSCRFEKGAVCSPLSGFPSLKGT